MRKADRPKNDVDDDDDGFAGDDGGMKYKSKRSKKPNKTNAAQERAKIFNSRVRDAEEEEEARLKEKQRVRDNAKADRVAKEELERDGWTGVGAKVSVDYNRCAAFP